MLVLTPLLARRQVLRQVSNATIVATTIGLIVSLVTLVPILGATFGFVGAVSGLAIGAAGGATAIIPSPISGEPLWQATWLALYAHRGRVSINGTKKQIYLGAAPLRAIERPFVAWPPVTLQRQR